MTEKLLHHQKDLYENYSFSRATEILNEFRFYMDRNLLRYRIVSSLLRRPKKLAKVYHKFKKKTVVTEACK